MNFDLSPGPLVNAASGLLLLLLGIAVLRTQPRRPGTTVLGLFVATFGYTWVPQNLLADANDPLSLSLLATVVVALALASVLLVVVALRFPAPIRARGRATLVAGAVASPMVALAIAQAVLPEVEPGVASLGPSFTALYLGFVIAQTAFFAASTFGLVLVALRWRSLAALPHGRANAAVISAALLLWPGLFTGARLLSPPSWLLASGALYLAGALVVAGLWLRSAASAEGREARWARDIALLVLGTPALGMALALAVGGPGPASSLPHLGLARTFGVALLAYAILRQQLLGIDVKVRWTVKQGTMAGAFLLVFFAASEAAEVVLAQAAGSEWVGVAAAGALTFALAPLQRAAERIAQVAVPLPASEDAARAAPMRGKERAYRAALRRALRDGALSRADEGELAHLADELGLPARRAMELRNEALAAGAHGGPARG